MIVHCTRCDHPNDSNHRFCGMCGDLLPRYEKPRGVSTPSLTPNPAPVSGPPFSSVAGPSFLGLAEPTGEGEYLLEDEPRSKRWAVYLVLAVLLATGAFAARRWHGDWDKWRAQMAALQSRPATKDQVPVDAGNNSPAVAQKPASSEPIAAGTQPTDSALPPVSAADSPFNGNERANNQPAAMETSNVEQPSVESSEKQPVAAAPNSKRPEETTAELRKTSVQTPHEDTLVIEGEKYLYGNGVPKNCDRARTNLFSAAEQSDAEAQGVLGIMFATGHCATVDLPSAYYWLSRAQRQNPADPRITSNLRIVWKEMTPDQQQAAARISR